MKALTARHYLIGGQVQGVGFRYFVQRAAVELGITGWARNLADGRVEVHANGKPDLLSDFEASLRRGPSLADVRSFEAADAAVTDAGGFHIR